MRSGLRGIVADQQRHQQFIGSPATVVPEHARLPRLSGRSGEHRTVLCHDDEIAEVRLDVTLEAAEPGLRTRMVLATKGGLVKKSELTAFDSNRAGGLQAINLREDDELVGAVLCSATDDLLLISAEGQSIRFHADDETLRPMGRQTSGVQGMRFNGDDELLSLNVVREGTFLLVATSGG